MERWMEKIVEDRERHGSWMNELMIRWERGFDAYRIFARKRFLC